MIKIGVLRHFLQAPTGDERGRLGVKKKWGESGMIKIGVLRHFLQALSITMRDEPTDEHGNRWQRALVQLPTARK